MTETLRVCLGTTRSQSSASWSVVVYSGWGCTQQSHKSLWASSPVPPHLQEWARQGCGSPLVWRAAHGGWSGCVRQTWRSGCVAWSLQDSHTDEWSWRVTEKWHLTSTSLRFQAWKIATPRGWKTVQVHTLHIRFLCEQYICIQTVSTTSSCKCCSVRRAAHRGQSTLSLTVNTKEQGCILTTPQKRLYCSMHIQVLPVPRYLIIYIHVSVWGYCTICTYIHIVNTLRSLIPRSSFTQISLLVFASDESWGGYTLWVSDSVSSFQPVPCRSSSPWGQAGWALAHSSMHLLQWERSWGVLSHCGMESLRAEEQEKMRRRVKFSSGGRHLRLGEFSPHKTTALLHHTPRAPTCTILWGGTSQVERFSYILLCKCLGA